MSDISLPECPNCCEPQYACQCYTCAMCGETFTKGVSDERHLRKPGSCLASKIRQN